MNQGTLGNISHQCNCSRGTDSEATDESVLIERNLMGVTWKYRSNAVISGNGLAALGSKRGAR